MASQISRFFPRIRTASPALSRGCADFLHTGVNLHNSFLGAVAAALRRPLHSWAGRSGKGSARRVSDSVPARPNASSSPVRARGRAHELSWTAVGAVGAAVYYVHSSARAAMAAGPERPEVDVNSAEGDWREAKDFLLSLSVDERRQHYRTSTYVTLDKIPVWTPTSDGSERPRYPRNEKLDQKISLYSGDITKLEIDAIVNAANKTLLGGGGVDGAIHRAAGPKLRNECATLNGCETGQAKITCGYGLPAKYVIHTVGPIVMEGVTEEERSALRACYRNCLETAMTPQHAARSLAFPCISTGVYGYPPEQAVHEALSTVREFLDEHHDKLDRVIFCVFLPTDKELYLKNLPLYFPGGCPSMFYFF
ncbi:ADP-ribose glycohydrolase MACROD1 [Lampris incognitus]|uniref:ADP-ribose glycohydrolase MACROD1 n=1 Tax=Lampris incognitus TaxID=2546036 RepID=UPI0024B4BCF6|nr:ADP-ribose glycohydrolase MACROD1 [Lampris incognitus]